MPRVLVIEDDAAIRGVIHKALQRGGHYILEAANGLEGMAIFRFGKIDLVITDLLMPGQDGGVTIRRIRELDPHVPIIAISGSDAKDSPLEDAMIGGANMRLTKPFSFDDLLAAVDVFLEMDGEA